MMRAKFQGKTLNIKIDEFNKKEDDLQMDYRGRKLQKVNNYNRN